VSISIGLVGLGAFGKNFAELFRAHPQVSRIGLCDREPERIQQFISDPHFKNKFNAEKDCFVSLGEILKSDLDAIIIITQPWLHAEQAVKAMENGKHVYTAVPLVELPDGNEILDWCDRLINTCNRTGMQYMLGETTVYRAETMYCKRMRDQGLFGDFVFSQGEYFHDFSALINVKNRRLSSASGEEWRKLSKQYYQKGVRESPMHYPTHSVSGPIHVMQTYPVKVSAFGYQSRTGHEYFDDHEFSNETALFQMKNGSSMRICEYREIGYRARESFSIFGTKGSFFENSWRELTGTTSLSKEDMQNSLPVDVGEAFRHIDKKSNIYGGHGGSHPYLVHEFVDSIVHQRMPAINVWEASRYMAAGVTAHQSALKDGEILNVPDWGDPPV